MKGVRVDFNYSFDAFHSLSSKSSKFLVANAQHDIFKCLEQISYFGLNMKKSDDVPHICNIDQVATSNPCLVFLKCAPISDRIKFILALKFVLFVIVHIFLVESLLSG